jgi:acetyl-CoA carboxylase biotin carboxyl carrier protein
MVLNREDALVRYYERSSEPNSLKREAEITAGRNENQEGEDPLQNNKNNGKYHIVEAPLVGTFYRASSPDEEPFVEVGDQVADGDILCIVEAMKSMNEIQADVSGVIKEICVNNSELVEFEQPLFKIDTGS